jgi:hypothetical protein
MSRADDAVHRQTVTGQIPMGIGDSVTDRNLLGADGSSDEVTPRQEEHVKVEMVSETLIEILATSYGVSGIKGCLEKLLSRRREIPQLSRFP